MHDAEPPETRREASPTAGSHVRGSTLLFIGRLLSTLLNGAAQVLMARWFSKAEYGALAYGLAAVLFAQNLTMLGLTNVITRFVPIYEERRQFGKALGTVMLVIGTVVATGLFAVGVVHVFVGPIERFLIHDRRAVSLLLILVVLIPLEAVDDSIEGLFAVIGRPGLIFLRKYLLGPGLRLGVVVILASRGASPGAVATAYVLVSAASLTAYVMLLRQTLRGYSFPFAAAWREIQLPVREVATLSLPLFVTGFIMTWVQTSDAFFLGRFAGTVEVAELRAVQPPGRLVQTVLVSFSLLFTAVASRLFAREDRNRLNELYWRTTMWIALFSFPIFVIMFVFAHPVTTTLFGSRYEGSEVVLALLSLGFFFHGMLGPNAQVLSVFRQLRYLVGVSIITLVLNVAIMIVVVPRFGVIGAGAAKAASLILFNLMVQAGLPSRTGIRFFDARFVPSYVAIVSAVAGLWVLEQVIHMPLIVGIGMTALVWMLLAYVMRSALAIDEVFPEFARVPILRFFSGADDEA